MARLVGGWFALIGTLGLLAGLLAVATSLLHGQPLRPHLLGSILIGIVAGTVGFLFLKLRYQPTGSPDPVSQPGARVRVMGAVLAMSGAIAFWAGSFLTATSLLKGGSPGTAAFWLLLVGAVIGAIGYGSWRGRFRP